MIEPLPDLLPVDPPPWPLWDYTRPVLVLCTIYVAVLFLPGLPVSPSLFWASLFATLMLLGVRYSWEGTRAVGLAFQVVDARTGQPVESATVIVARSGGFLAYEDRTGTDGTAQVVVPCWVLG